MSLIKHSNFPRSMFDTDLWHQPMGFGQRALDVFDPFDDLDMSMNNSLRWLQRPDFIRSPFEQPKVPQKYRISVDVNGFNHQSIHTEIQGDRLIISGQEGARHGEDEEEYNLREFKKTYKLPKDVECDKMVSFITKQGQLVVEFPLRVENSIQDMMPHVVDMDNGGKGVNMKLCLPSHIDPSELSITAKDRDIIVKGEHKEDNTNSNGNSHSEFYYYRRSTMPENTDMDHLKCTIDENNNQLMLCAPIFPTKNIPIEGGNMSKQQQQQLNEQPKKKALLHG